MNAVKSAKGIPLRDLILIAHAHSQAWMAEFALSHGILPEAITNGVSALLRYEGERSSEEDHLSIPKLRVHATKMVQDFRRQMERTFGALHELPAASKGKRRISAKGRRAMKLAQQKRWAKKELEENSPRRTPHKISAKGMRAIQKAQKLRRAREKQARLLLHQGGKKAA